MEGFDENVITRILKCTSPTDVCRLALVSQTWARAASSDAIWEKFIPSDYSQIFSDIPSNVLLHRAIHRYKKLKSGFNFSDGKKHVIIDSKINKIRLSIAITDNFSFIWGDHPIYWEYIPGSSYSVFNRGAYLRGIVYFEVHGEFSLSLPEGTYSVCWRLSRDYGRRYKSLKWKSTVEFNNEPPIETTIPIPAESIASFPRWSEVKVGEIVIGKRENSPIMPSTFKVSLIEIRDDTRWKSGLCLDGIVFLQV